MIKSHFFPRSRRLAIALGTVSALALSACGGSNSVVTKSSDAYTVEGKSVSKKEFNGIVNELVKAGQFKTTNGKVAQADITQMLNIMIRDTAFDGFAKSMGIKITDAMRKEIAAGTAKDAQFSSIPKNVQDLIISLNEESLAMKALKAPSADKLEELYNSAPVKTGTLCLSHILLKTKAQADKVLKELDGGASFAKVAEAKSIDPSAKGAGGALKDGKEDCSLLTSLQQSFDKDFLAGAISAKAGVPTGPVKSQFGYHIILSHEFKDVKDSVASVIKEDPASALMAGYIATAKISVNSMYGKWNSVTSTIE